MIEYNEKKALTREEQKRMPMKKDIIRIIFNAVLAVMTFTVWILSFFLWRDASLGGDGWSDLKYFTVQSNLLVGLFAVLWIVARLTGKQGKWLTVLKYVSSVSVFVTFTVVVAFLGPLYTYGRMYYGSNLFFHLLIPLLAVSEFVFFEEGELSFKDTFFALIHPFVYGVGYLANCMINGVGSWETVRNDWYSFLEWGYGVGIAFFFVIGAVAWGLGLSLRAMNKPARKIKWGE